MNITDIFDEELETLKSILLEGEIINEGPLRYTLVLRPNTGCDTEKVTVIMKMDVSFPEKVIILPYCVFFCVYLLFLP